MEKTRSRTIGDKFLILVGGVMMGYGFALEIVSLMAVGLIWAIISADW